MSNIKIETLTAVHIGSGETLQYGNDFVYGKSSEDNTAVFGIIDARKVMQLIGEENIDKWVTAIERKEATDEIVKVYAPKAKIEDYSKRTILAWVAPRETDTLKEHIHNGLGVPYIPGSSIKGGIRTAILSSIAEASDNDILKSRIINDRNRNKMSAKGVETHFFGKDPNSDIFRFLQVGDAYFGNEYEIAIRMVNINEREKQSFWDKSKSQLIEAICPGDKASFQLKLNINLYECAEKSVHPLPECMRSISNIFRTINKHTESLIKTEIEYWKERTADDESGQVDVYLEKLDEIRVIVEQCENGKSCILRIGHGSGWRFITGAWSENLDIFYPLIVPASRPRNDVHANYDFPKTRRVDDECELLGFVKLTV